MLWNNCMGLYIKLSSKKTSSTAKCLRVINGWQLKQRIKPFDEKYYFFNTNQIHFYEVTIFMYYCAHRLQPAIFDDYHKFVTNVSRYQRWSRRHKARGQGQKHKKNPRPRQPYQGQTLSRPRTGMLEAKANDQGHKRTCSPKKKVFRKNFQAISK